ncbi:putative RING finger protein P8B7.23 [Purpureocillium lavendulum]|uniref:RING finger protein P8B7.23 n=1 Tax=Purpureocillium lavendulum TaxID=1247861 RepID=A0AB34FWV0_9HYPO|nr:putative RING finger protein P8B7.23 [Purpureocillium lavendulum]
MSFPSRTLDPIARSSSVRARRQPASSSSLHCCCGRPDCILLKRNCSILESVEKDVHTAAQLGQALLVRHEAYMADAERDRLELSTRIHELELAKLDLEAINATKIEENRNLLDQLESLNNTISDSDTRIKSLEANLLSSQQSVRRLEAAAVRAADAERHIAVLEDEQNKLHEELRSSREDARSHSQRFKEAERGLTDMQDQLERMEKEARQERERHAEVVERMERQREIDKQLDMAAGRLKGAAASKQLQEHKSNNKIVGHFVRDLLEDNANLQVGIAELREMLLNSNDEIQSLREQLMFHQPVDHDQPHDISGPVSTLKAELEPSDDKKRLSQELHIHHHYHVTPKSEAKKPKKRRQGLLPGTLTPPALSAPSSPRRPGKWGGITPSPTAPALLSHADDGDMTPTMPKSRNSWAGCSNPPSEFSSSAPSSPPSAHRHAVFDTSYGDSDAVQSPTTSFDPMSPTWRASHSKRASVASSRSYQSMSAPLLDSVPDTPCGNPGAHRPYGGHTIQEEDEDEDLEDLPPLDERPPPGETALPAPEATDDFEAFLENPKSRPRLRRAPSHESIMSLTGGLEIHTLKARPSQMTLRPIGGADVVVTGVTAQPTLSRASGKRSDAALRDHFVGFQTPRSVSSPMGPTASPGSGTSPTPRSRPFGKWVGWRPWGGSATPSAASPSPKAAERERDKDANRPPGINQAGAIPGFQQYWAAQKRKGAPAKVTAETVDRDALVDGLRE